MCVCVCVCAYKDMHSAILSLAIDKSLGRLGSLILVWKPV